MNKNMVIRSVCKEDAKRLVEIYSYYVESTAVSFEYHTPSIEEFENRIETIQKNYPYLLCEIDGKIVGYVYANAYSSREAYDWTVTTSIYLDKDSRRMGIGTALYEKLEEELKKKGIVNLLAAIAYIDKEDEYLTNDSLLFHGKSGYTEVAHMTKVGKKFDIWYDIIWMQKVIS